MVSHKVNQFKLYKFVKDFFTKILEKNAVPTDFDKFRRKWFPDI